MLAQLSSSSQSNLACGGLNRPAGMPQGVNLQRSHDKSSLLTDPVGFLTAVQRDPFARSSVAPGCSVN